MVEATGWFPVLKVPVLGARPCTWEIVHVQEQTSMLLTITWDGCTKLVLKPLPAKNGLSVSVFCVYCYFPVDYTISVYMMILVHYAIYLHKSAIIFDKLKREAV